MFFTFLSIGPIADLGVQLESVNRLGSEWHRIDKEVDRMLTDGCCEVTPTKPKSRVVILPRTPV